MKLLALFGVASALDAPSALFDRFKKEHNKVYASPAEELKRYKIFIDNAARVEKMKVLDPTATYDVTGPLSDITEDEFEQRNSLHVSREQLAEHEAKAITLKTKPLALPSDFDWVTKGALVGVKNQGQCGSCWTFGTAASVEGSNFVVNGEKISLSEQQLVDCDTTDNGCNGGLPSNAYKYLMNHKMGLELETEYPYEASQHQCRAEESHYKVSLQTFHYVSQNEDQIAEALMQYGSLAIGINASQLQLYRGGIMDPWFCNPYGLNHAVTIVGFGEEGGVKYWKIRNSWGSGWGEEGYFRIIRGKGKCGLNRMVTAAVVHKKTNDPIFG